MRRTRYDSFPISYFLIPLALAGFFVMLVLALRYPGSCQPDLHQQFVQIGTDSLAGDGTNTIYQKTLLDYRWSQPVCAVAAKRTPYSVYLDGVLLHEYTPCNFDHGGMVHWIPLPDTELAGHVLTVSAPSEKLTVLVGDYGDLLLYYRKINAPVQMFSGLFLLLGILIGLLSLGVMALLRRVPGLSLFGVSMAGAAAHNTGQILSALVVLGSLSPLVYLPPLLLCSLVTGAFTGAVAALLVRYVPSPVESERKT